MLFAVYHWLLTDTPGVPSLVDQVRNQHDDRCQCDNEALAATLRRAPLNRWIADLSKPTLAVKTEEPDANDAIADGRRREPCVRSCG